MKGKRFIALLVIVVVLGSLVLACQPAVAPAPAPAPAPKAKEAQYYGAWRMGSMEVEDSYGMLVGHRFNDVMGEMTDKRIQTSLFALGTLGDAAEMVELTQSGDLNLLPGAASWMSGFIPEANVFSLDYILPTTRKGLLGTLNDGATSKIMVDVFADRGFYYLSGSSIGAVYRSSNEPLYNIDDFKGFKMRVMPSPILIESYKAYGANPTPLPFGEVYTGLQTGLIEGQENPAKTMISMRFYEVQTHLSLAKHRNFIFTGVANLAWWNTLPGDVQEMVKSAWLQGQEYAMSVYDEKNVETLGKLGSLIGPKYDFYELTAEDMAPFKEASKNVWAIYLKPEIGGPRAQEVLDALSADLATYEK